LNVGKMRHMQTERMDRSKVVVAKKETLANNDAEYWNPATI